MSSIFSDICSSRAHFINALISSLCRQYAWIMPYVADTSLQFENTFTKLPNRLKFKTADLFNIIIGVDPILTCCVSCVITSKHQKVSVQGIVNIGWLCISAYFCCHCHYTRNTQKVHTSIWYSQNPKTNEHAYICIHLWLRIATMCALDWYTSLTYAYRNQNILCDLFSI